VLVEHPDAARQQVLEVKRVADAHLGLQQFPHLRDRGALGMLAALAHPRGRHELAFRHRDLLDGHPGEVRCQCVLLVAVTAAVGFDELHEDLAQIRLVVDRVLVRAPETLRVPAQHPAAQTVEGRHRHALAELLAQHPHETYAHLLGRADGEGQREDLVRGDSAADERRHPLGDRCGLAGAGPGEHEHRPALVVHDGLLLAAERAGRQTGDRGRCVKHADLPVDGGCVVGDDGHQRSPAPAPLAVWGSMSCTPTRTVPARA
jgi:hypothetical protein